MARVRDFNPAALADRAAPHLQVAWKRASRFEGRVWQFMILLPRVLVTSRGRETVCTGNDEDLLRRLLEEDFGGCTSSPHYMHGVGRRGAAFETNLNRQMTVLASRWRGTWRYFKTLRKELEACSGEEQILILHQEVYIV